MSKVSKKKCGQISADTHTHTQPDTPEHTLKKIKVRETTSPGTDHAGIQVTTLIRLRTNFPGKSTRLARASRSAVRKTSRGRQTQLD